MLPDSQIEPLTWNELAGWQRDDHAAAFAAFRASCQAIVKQKAAPREGRPIDAALLDVCRRAIALGPASNMQARHFFETRFRPLRVSRLGETDGLLTGYYEPIVEGSRIPSQEYTVPMYRRPKDLVPGIVQAGLGFPNKGGAWRQVDSDTRVPYYDRAEIETGALDGKGLEICWVKDPVDAFFIHIQGSARVRLEDGAVLRLNYDGHNGHSYTSVGRLLIEQGHVPREQMSMERIREWMRANPEAAKEVRRQNRSFVFFRIAELTDHEEAVGGQGIPLTVRRSIAVDRKLHAYGTPFWIEAELPLTSDTSREPFRRLMIAQDTGSAIIGPARADLYFGAGEEAGRIAGRIKHPGKFVMLVPRSMDPASVVVPFPRRKPRS